MEALQHGGRMPGLFNRTTASVGKRLAEPHHVSYEATGKVKVTACKPLCSKHKRFLCGAQHCRVEGTYNLISWEFLRILQGGLIHVNLYKVNCMKAYNYSRKNPINDTPPLNPSQFSLSNQPPHEIVQIATRLCWQVQQNKLDCQVMALTESSCCL